MFKSVVIKDYRQRLILAPIYTIADVKSNKRGKGNRKHKGTGTGEDCRTQDGLSDCERFHCHTGAQPCKADRERPYRALYSVQELLQSEGKGKQGKEQEGISFLLPSFLFSNNFLVLFMSLDDICLQLQTYIPQLVWQAMGIIK